MNQAAQYFPGKHSGKKKVQQGTLVTPVVCAPISELQVP